MTIVFSVSNCFWLILPILIWNLILGSRLPQAGFQNDHLVPTWLLWSEHGLRLFVFGLPLILAFKMNKTGLLVYCLGTLLYFATWLPLLYGPQSSWSVSPIGILAPFITPILVFSGISLISQSWLYFGVSLLFTCIHVIHGVKSFELLK